MRPAVVAGDQELYGPATLQCATDAEKTTTGRPLDP
jgi:hypothetical protein